MTRRMPVVALAGSRWCRVCLGLTIGMLGACRLQDDLIARRVTGATNGGASSSAGDAGDAGNAGNAGDAGASAECPGFVPSVSATLSGVHQEMCAGWIARRAFSQAVCSCADLNVLAVLASDALDSTVLEPIVDRSGAAIGVNGSYSGGEYARIGGSFTVAGAAALSSRGGIDVAGDLRSAPTLSAAGPLFVGRDAWLLQPASSLSIATVGRDLHLGPNGTLTALGAVVTGGSTSHEPFEIAPPCACNPDALVDVAGIVSDGLAHNDNLRLGLELDSLSRATDPKELSLSCGRFALRGISADAAVRLRIAGRVLLFVDGDVELGRKFSFELGPGAELDWFIRGNLTVSGESLVGDQARPGATRLYVLGTGDIALPGTARFSANLYAPRARLAIGALGDVYGSVFGAAISSLGPLLAHYDRAVLEADAQCALPPPQTCNSCDQCGADQTCVGSACSTCTADRDCCFPLVCEMGACRALKAD